MEKDSIKHRPPDEPSEVPVNLHKQKQESLEKAVPKAKSAIAEMDAEGPEKFHNEDLIKRLVVFSIQLEEGKHGVLGKSPQFIAERFSAAFNASAPHVILSSYQKRTYYQYINQWLKTRYRRP